MSQQDSSHQHHQVHLDADQVHKHFGGRLIPRHESDPFDLRGSIVVATITFIIFFFFNVYFKNKYNAKYKNDEFGARICSLIHAVISTFGSGYALFEHDGGWFDIKETTRLQGYWQSFSFAYFACDQVMMLLGKFDYMYTLHHVITLSCCGLPALLGIHGFPVCFATCFGEVSNIPMHWRWLLHAVGDGDSALCKFLTRSFFASFFILRFCIGPWFVPQMAAALPVYYFPFCWGLLIASWAAFIDFVRNPNTFDGVGALHLVGAPSSSSSSSSSSSPSSSSHDQVKH